MRERMTQLRLILPFSGAVLALAALVGLIAGGPVAALGAAGGVGLVTASYLASTLAIAWADMMNPRMVFPVGMTMYLTKFSLLGVFLVVVGSTDWAGKIPLAMGICAGVVAWTGAQIWWITHHAHPYVGHADGRDMPALSEPRLP